MTIIRNLDDTTKMRPDSRGSSDRSNPVQDETAKLKASPSVRKPEIGLTGRVHACAQGIIRFYRARTILQKDSSVAGCRRAWSYLEHLQPGDLPATARRYFFELTYALSEKPLESVFESGDFEERVSEITVLIDEFVDDMNSDLDSKH